MNKECTLCGEIFPLNEHGECESCVEYFEEEDLDIKPSDCF